MKMTTISFDSNGSLTGREATLAIILLLYGLFTTSICRADDDAMTAANRLLEARQWELAIAGYEQIVADTKRPMAERAVAYSRCGQALQGVKKFHESIEKFQAALAIEQASDEVRWQSWIGIGYAHRRMRDNEKAVMWFEKVLASPDAPPGVEYEAGANASTAYQKLGKSDKARELLRRIAQIEGAHPYNRTSAWVSLGQSYAGAKEYEAAREAYLRALAEGDNGKKTASARTKLQELELLAQPDSPVFMLPWVKHVSAADAAVRWVAKGDVSPAKLSLTSGACAIETRRVIEIHPGFFLYESKLTGLSANTQYAYVVEGGDKPAPGSFVTPDDLLESVTFCVMGDTQSQARVHTALAQLIADQKPEFVLHAGDCVERGGDWLQWQTQVFGPGRPYLALAPLYPARGNHDGGSYFPNLFGLNERQYYSVDRGLVHVIAFDSFGPDSSGERLQAQAQWVDQTFAASDAPWKIVIVHDPMVNADLRSPWWGLDHFMPVIEKHRVAVVFSGHHHQYRRFLPLHPPGETNGSGTWHITTGGAGGGLSGKTVSPLMVDTQLVHHFVRVDADADQFNMTVIDIEGNVIDRIALQHDDSGKVFSSTEQPVDRKVAHHMVSFYTALSPYKVLDETSGTYRDGQVVIDLTTLPQGPLNTNDYPADVTLKISAAPGSTWRVKPTTLQLRGITTLMFPASPAAENAGPLIITLTPYHGDRVLTPHTLQVFLESIDAVKEARSTSANVR